MAAEQEMTIWSETPLKTHWWLSCLLILPIPYALWKILQLSNQVYELTSQRIRTRFGVLSKKTEVVELYRVKDLAVEEPFALRLFSSGNIILNTSDVTTPRLVIPGIRNPEQRANEIRKYVEEARLRNRTRMVEEIE